MTLFRSDLAIALDGVVIACCQAADVHRVAAEACHGRGRALDLLDLADRRAADADAIGDVMATRSDGPNAQPAEKVLAKKAVTWLKSALAPDDAAILESCRAEEQAVRAAVRAALALDMADDIRRRLVALSDDAERRIDELRPGAGAGRTSVKAD